MRLSFNDSHRCLNYLFLLFGSSDSFKLFETMNFFIRPVEIIELLLLSACEGVTYEILDLYRFLVTELAFLDDILLNYMSQRQNLQILEGVSTQLQSSGLVAHENNTFRNLALAVSGPFMV